MDVNQRNFPLSAPQWERGPGVSRKLPQNAVKSRVQICHDLGVCYADDSQAQGGQHEFSFAVAGILLGLQVDAAVDFEDQCEFGAVEVCDEGANGVLTAELKATEASVADALPNARLGIRERPSQAPGSGDVVAVESLAFGHGGMLRPSPQPPIH